MNEHLSLERECVHSPIIFNPRVSKGLGCPSLGTPIVVYRLLLRFKMSKTQSPKVGRGAGGRGGRGGGGFQKKKLNFL